MLNTSKQQLEGRIIHDSMLKYVFIEV